MFQQKYIEEYQSITAPTELKDRIRFSVNKARRTTRQKMMMFGVMAAGMTLFCVAGSLVWNSSLLGNHSTILSVNDVVVTREALQVDHQEGVLLTEKLGHQKSLPIHIPMEIKVKGITKIEVNVGTCIQELDENQYSVETTQMELSKTAKLYWMLEGDFDDIPTLTIISGKKIDQYVVEYQADTEQYSIRKVN